MARILRDLAAVLRRPAPPLPEPWRLPVPSPAFWCPVHDTAWNGPGGCFICEPQPSQESQLSQPEES